MPGDTFTLVTAVDRAHLEQLEVVLPTWRRNRYEAWRWPWLVIYDQTQLTAERIRAALESEFANRLDLRLQPWPPQGLEYASQRAKMLAAYVHVPPMVVRTPWWMKIDTDVIAKEFNPQWIPSTKQLAGHVVLAPRWGYTKPANQMAIFDAWAGGEDGGLFTTPKLSLPFDPESGKCSHPRFCSWVSFYRTDWTREVSGFCPHGWLPAASQDGYHFYCLARQGLSWGKYHAKAFGWTNTPRLAKLKVSAAAVMEIMDHPMLESDTREEDWGG